MSPKLGQKTPTSPSSKPYVFGLAGGSCSGKGMISSYLCKVFSTPAVVVNQKDFYKEQPKRGESSDLINFDTPEAIDFELMKKTL